MSKTSTVTMSHQSGFNMIELLVALALGALLTAAAVQMFATNQRTFQLQMAISETQEQGRFGLDYMLRDLRQMGLVELDSITGLPVGTAGLLTTSHSIGSTVVEASAEGGAGATDNDRVSFTYYGFQDCEGDILTPAVAEVGEEIGNTYWVDAGELKCKGSVDPATTGITLVSGVDSFQVLYGVDRDPDGKVFATSYVNKTQVLAADVVVSVKLGLLVRAESDRQSQGAADSFVVLDKVLSGGNAPLAESRIRRLFSSTVRVRNYDWTSI